MKLKLYWGLGIVTTLSALFLSNTFKHTPQMKKTQVTEVVIYEVLPEQAQNNKLLIEEVNAAVSDFDGFISRKVYQSPEDSTLLMDYVEWESLEQAKAAAKQMQEKSELKPFLQAIKEVKVFHHFEEK